jgi:hypothetical protein
MEMEWEKSIAFLGPVVEPSSARRPLINNRPKVKSDEVDQTPQPKNVHTPRSHYTGTIYPRVKEQIGMLKMVPL